MNLTPNERSAAALERIATALEFFVALKKPKPAKKRAPGTPKLPALAKDFTEEQKQASTHTYLIRFYSDKHNDVFKFRPIIDVKLRSAITRYLKEFSIEQIENWIKYYLTSRDDFIANKLEHGTGGFASAPTMDRLRKRIVSKNY